MVHCATHLHHCKYTICETKCDITAVKYCVLHTLKKKPCNVRQHKNWKWNDHNSGQQWQQKISTMFCSVSRRKWLTLYSTVVTICHLHQSQHTDLWVPPNSYNMYRILMYKPLISLCNTVFCKPLKFYTSFIKNSTFYVVINRCSLPHCCTSMYLCNSTAEDSKTPIWPPLISTQLLAIFRHSL
jgi:hypothetical protein